MRRKIYCTRDVIRDEERLYSYLANHAMDWAANHEDMYAEEAGYGPFEGGFESSEKFAEYAVNHLLDNDYISDEEFIEDVQDSLEDSSLTPEVLDRFIRKHKDDFYRDAVARFTEYVWQG